MKQTKELGISGVPAPIADLIRALLPDDAEVEITSVGVSSPDAVRDSCSGLPCEKACPLDCPIEAAHAAANTPADDPTRSAVCEEPEDADYDRRKPYISLDGKRYTAKPRPEEYVEDAEDSYLETYHVVTVYKSGDDGFLTPVARHGFGDNPPTDIQIKWCILRYQGDTAIVTKEYGLGF